MIARPDEAKHGESGLDAAENRGGANPKRRRWPVVLALALVAVVLAALARFVWFAPAPSNAVLALSGRIEGDDSAIAAKTSGRIREIRFREGDRVTAGDVLALLDDDQIRARERQAEASVEQSVAAVLLAHRAVDVLNQQLIQSGLGIDQAKRDAGGRVMEAEAQVASAQAALAQAKASYTIARFNADAYAKLLKKDEVSEQQALQMKTTADAQAAVIEAAERQVEASRGALEAAQSALVNPDIRTAQTNAIRRQLVQQQAQIDETRAGAAHARAQLAEAQANRRDLDIVAPFNGVVATRLAEPGEVIAAGTPLMTVIDLHLVYLRGFIPEGQIGRVRLGQKARVYLDSAPHRPLDAFVSRIDPEASFTPENTYFRDDRVKQVVGVKLQLLSPGGFAKPGMPADGEILVSGDAWPGGR